MELLWSTDRTKWHWCSAHSLLVVLWLQALCCLTWSNPQPALPDCNSCPPGYGVVSVCNSTHDTTCAPCPQGTYNARHTLDFSCSPCSACEALHYERIPCTSKADTVCVSCFSQTGRGFGNEDFLRNCESLTTTTSTTTTTSAPTTTTTESPVVKSTETVVLIKSNEKINLEEAEEGSGSFEPGMISESGLKISTSISTSTSTSTSVKATTAKTSSSSSSTTTTTHAATKTTTENPKLIPEKLPSPTKEEVPTTAFVNPEEIPLVGEEDTVTTNASGAAIEVPLVGEQRAEEEKAGAHAGFFQWQVLVAAAVAGVVCFVLGVLISAIIHKQRSSSEERLTYNLDEDQVTTTMITPRQNYSIPNSKYPGETGEAKTPIYMGPPPESPIVPVMTPSGFHNDHEPDPEKQPFDAKDAWAQAFDLVKQAFNIPEVPYIDEDSDDEIVQSTGRPRTLDYRDKDLFQQMAAQGSMESSHEESTVDSDSYSGTDISPPPILPSGGQHSAFV